MANYSRLPGTDVIAGWTNEASGVSVSRSYEADRDLPVAVTNSVGATMISAYDYANDALGRRTQRLDAGANAATYLFAYNVRSELTNGVTPLFSPTKAQINDMLERHRVWVHSGHGCNNTNGIEIVRKVGDDYRQDCFKASDIEVGNVEYDLVFMNTCLSTDRKYVADQAGNWSGPSIVAPDQTVVLDIGTKLRARNYDGWDCEVMRSVSVEVPMMLMVELDSTAAGERGRRTVAVAVAKVKETLLKDGKTGWWYYERLRCVKQDDSVRLDLNRKPL